ncbi:CBS domain-containing protein [Pseudokordiimonas caeni]|uniref:CBS domain-containing protein n=1 Tax=Pseudokordiimonas caeni TaxID=2997908 RepID=UPI002811B3A5|nr:CBS domain-containing protein [Pseudokordiimonas caeni]
MKVEKVMTREAEWVGPDITIPEAAKRMKEKGIGILPIGENDKLIGMLSDRDIVINCLANGLDMTSTKVRDAMSKQVLYVYDDQSVEEAAKSMADNQVRRMPVLNRQKRLVGMVTIADIAGSGSAKAAGEALGMISR